MLPSKEGRDYQCLLPAILILRLRVRLRE
uniref:Uncharacterized protein n=1 Tax=Arundo donax TaxID=35708 RepID=A0A0A9C4N9_ARUDO